MRTYLLAGEKPLHWIGSSKRDLLHFPARVLRAMGYAVRFSRAVYVLHAFQKKSPSGIRTARTDIALTAQRLRAAEEDYEVRYGKEED